MKFGDIPLKYLRSGIQLFNSAKTKIGTLLYTPHRGWVIDWNNVDGSQSVILAIDDEHSQRYYDLEVVVVDGKIVVGSNWYINEPDVYTHAS